MFIFKNVGQNNFQSCVHNVLPAVKQAQEDTGFHYGFRTIISNSAISAETMRDPADIPLLLSDNWRL